MPEQPGGGAELFRRGAKLAPRAEGMAVSEPAGPPDDGAVETVTGSLPGMPDGRAAAAGPPGQPPPDRTGDGGQPPGDRTGDGGQPPQDSSENGTQPPGDRTGDGGQPSQDSSENGPGQPLLAGSARPWAGALLAGCAVAVAVLGVLVAHQARADWLDRAVDSPVVAWFGGRPHLASWLAVPGSQVPAAVLSAAIAVACLIAGRLNGAVLAAAAVPAAVGLNDGLLKPLVHRTSLGFLTYPSGHTATMFALAATIAVLLLASPRPARAGPLRVLLPTVACLAGVVVALAVIGLRWHYFTDTVAGAAVGIGTVCGLALILDLPALRRWLAPAGRWLARAGRWLAAARGRRGEAARARVGGSS